MKPDHVWLLARICLILALMHWAHMPFWGATILFVCLQINISLHNLGAYLVLWTSAASAALMQDDDGPHLHAVPDEDA